MGGRRVIPSEASTPCHSGRSAYPCHSERSEAEPRNPAQAGVKSRRCSRRPQRRTPQHDMGGRRVIPSGAPTAVIPSKAKWSRGIPPRLESSPGDAHVVRSGGLLSMTWVAAVSFEVSTPCHSERSEVEPRNPAQAGVKSRRCSRRPQRRTPQHDMGGRRVIPSEAERGRGIPPRLESSPGDAHVVRSGGLLSMTWVAAVSFRAKRLPCHVERSEAEPRNPPQAGVKSRRCSRRPQRRTPQHDMGDRRVIPTEAPAPVIPSGAPTPVIPRGAPTPVIPGVAKWSRGIPPRLESSPGDAHVVRSGGLLSMTWVAAVSCRAERLRLSFRAERLPLSFRAERVIPSGAPAPVIPSAAKRSRGIPPGWSQVQEMLTSSAAADSSA